MDHYSRRQLKEDKVAEGAAQAAVWLTENKKSFLVPATIVVLLAIVLGGAGWWYQTQKQQASIALGKAFLTYNSAVGAEAQPGIESYPTDQERLAAAKKAFYAVSEHYGFTGAGQAAHYLAATIEIELGNNQIAEDQLKSVIAHSNRNYTALANFALASLYRATGRETEAAAIYKKLAEKPVASVSKVTVQLAQADMLAASSPAQARQIYEQIAKENAKTEIEELVKSKSDTLAK